MTLDDFRQSLTATVPPAGLTLALAGLWWDARRIGNEPMNLLSRTKGFTEAIFRNGSIQVEEGKER